MAFILLAERPSGVRQHFWLDGGAFNANRKTSQTMSHSTSIDAA
jgi:hypothetical protein